MTDTYINLGGGPATTNADGGFGLVLAGTATLDALQVTMAGVGAGDNSANVTTMETNLDTLQSTLKKVCGADWDVSGPAAYLPSVIVVIDTTNVTTVSQLRAIFNGMLGEAQGKGLAL